MKIIICIAVVAIAFALGWNAKTLHVLHAITPSTSTRYRTLTHARANLHVCISTFS